MIIYEAEYNIARFAEGYIVLTYVVNDPKGNFWSIAEGAVPYTRCPANWLAIGLK